MDDKTAADVYNDWRKTKDASTVLCTELIVLSKLSNTIKRQVKFSFSSTIKYSQTCLNIGIKHVFPCINTCWVPRKVLKTEGAARGFQHLPRNPASVDARNKMFDRHYCINSTKALQKTKKLSAHFIL